MISAKEILKMAKATLRHDQGYPERRIIHPHREWLIGICIFAVLLLSGSVVAGLIFMHYQTIEEDIAASEQRIPNYQSGTVADVLALYGARAEEFSIFQGESIVTPLPPTDLATSSASSTTPDSSATSTDEVATSSSAADEEVVGE